jgi:hypothetical protein
VIIMSLELLWILPALALAPAAWFFATRQYKRKLAALHAQVKAVKQTAAEHANQARKQVAQLQAELAARPPMASAQREKRDQAAAEAVKAAEARRALAEKLVPDDGFHQTAIAPNRGFAKTEIMEG